MMRGMSPWAKKEISKRILNIVGYLFITIVLPKKTAMDMIHMTDEL
jgi:hypothetical protein